MRNNRLAWVISLLLIVSGSMQPSVADAVSREDRDKQHYFFGNRSVEREMLKAAGHFLGNQKVTCLYAENMFDDGIDLKGVLKKAQRFISLKPLIQDRDKVIVGPRTITGRLESFKENIRHIKTTMGETPELYVILPVLNVISPFLYASMYFLYKQYVSDLKKEEKHFSNLPDNRLNKKIEQELDLYSYMFHWSFGKAIFFKYSGYFNDWKKYFATNKQGLKQALINDYNGCCNKKRIDDFSVAINLDELMELARDVFVHIGAPESIRLFRKEKINGIPVDLIILNYGQVKIEGQKNSCTKAAIYSAFYETFGRQATGKQVNSIHNNLSKNFGLMLKDKLFSTNDVRRCIGQEIQMLQAICEGMVAKLGDTSVDKKFLAFFTDEYKGEIQNLLADMEPDFKYANGFRSSTKDMEVKNGVREHLYKKFQHHCDKNGQKTLLTERYFHVFLNSMVMKMLLQDVILPILE